MAVGGAWSSGSEDREVVAESVTVAVEGVVGVVKGKMEEK